MISKYFMRFSLKQRIYLGHALLVALFALVTSTAIFGFFQTYRRMAALTKISHQQLLQQEISQGVIGIANEVQRFTYEGHASAVERVSLLNQSLQNQFVEIRRTAASPEMKRLLPKMEEHLAIFNRTFQTVIGERTLRTKLIEEALPQARDAINEAFNSLEKDATIDSSVPRDYRLHFLEARADLFRYFEVLESKNLDSAERSLSTLQTDLEALERRKGQASPALAQARVAADAYHKALRRAVQATQGYLYLTDVVMAGEVAEFLYKSDKLRSISADYAQRGYAKARSSMTRAMIALVVTFLFVFVLAPIFAIRLSASIVEPIARITRTFRALAAGETLSHIPGGDLKHEMGELARAAEIFRQKNQEAQELRLKTEAAEAANRAKGVFLANMSHELRTPLNAILGYSRLMRADASVLAEQRGMLDIINRSGEHLLNLINSVLDMAKIEAGRVVLEVAPFDLRATVHDIAELMRQRAEAKGLRLELELAADLPAVFQADEVKLRQVLINLVGNAIKFTAQGSVTLRLRHGPGDRPSCCRLVIEVADTGAGIAAKDQPHIFEPFIQLGEKAHQKGTGLGLTIARQFVELMGGTIGVESAPGRGSTFRVELPLERGEAFVLTPTRARDRGPARLASGLPEYRILIVEDQRDNWMLLRQLMEQTGFQVRVAENGAEGVAAFQTWQPHFIWMDWRMPVMDGLEATRRIRTLAGGRGVKLAVLSASVLKEEREEVLAAGADDFVAKPIQFDQLYDCLARHLGVTFVFDEPVAAATTGPGVNLEAAALAALPLALRNELAAAVVSLDATRIAGAIQRVAELNHALGSALKHHADQFECTVILRALKDETPK